MCSANINMQDSIGNKRAWARECFKELMRDGLKVNEVTTDLDGGAYKAAGKHGQGRPYFN